MGGLVTPSVRVHHARDLAQILLDGQTERWRHTIGVARRAEDLAGTVDDEAEILISAAWLHDIGVLSGGPRHRLPSTRRRPVPRSTSLADAAQRPRRPPLRCPLRRRRSGFASRPADGARRVSSRGVGGLRRAHLRRPDGGTGRPPDDASGTGHGHARPARARFAQRSGTRCPLALPGRGRRPGGAAPALGRSR